MLLKIILLICHVVAMITTCFYQDMFMPNVLQKASNGEQFLIFEEKINPDMDNSPKIVGFSLPNGIDLAKNAISLSIDGTFEIVEKTLFEQAWIVSARTPNGASVPVMYWLLPNKTKITYITVLNFMKGLGINPPKVFVDFEAAEHSAIKDVWPNTTVVGCDAHFKRSLHRNLQKANLIPYQNRSLQMQEFCRNVWALTLIPPEDVIKVNKKS